MIADFRHGRFALRREFIVDPDREEVENGNPNARPDIAACL
jgi:hypothetical protein